MKKLKKDEALPGVSYTCQCFLRKGGFIIMENNAMIKGVAYYHPENVVDNEYFIEHFKKQGKDIEGLLRATGRKSRYISTDEKENMLTMGYQASLKVLEQTHVKVAQINLIVFSSGTPEYIAPTNALKLHSMLNMESNLDIKYALLVGSDQLNRYVRYNEVVPYSNFADSACAMVIENVFSTKRGFIDSDFYTNSSNHDKILLPAKGMSTVTRDRNLPTEDKLVKWIPFDFGGAFHSAKISIEELLFKNGLQKDDIKKYYFSQLALKNIVLASEDLEEDIEKFKFVGDEFGYTGTTSPMLAYARSIEDKELQIGDYVVFWTVGAGTTCATVLYKY